MPNRNNYIQKTKMDDMILNIGLFLNLLPLIYPVIPPCSLPLLPLPLPSLPSLIPLLSSDTNLLTLSLERAGQHVREQLQSNG